MLNLKIDDSAFGMPNKEQNVISSSIKNKNQKKSKKNKKAVDFMEYAKDKGINLNIQYEESSKTTDFNKNKKFDNRENFNYREDNDKNKEKNYTNKKFDKTENFKKNNKYSDDHVKKYNNSNQNLNNNIGINHNIDQNNFSRPYQNHPMTNNTNFAGQSFNKKKTYQDYNNNNNLNTNFNKNLPFNYNKYVNSNQGYIDNNPNMNNLNMNYLNNNYNYGINQLNNYQNFNFNPEQFLQNINQQTDTLNTYPKHNYQEQSILEILEYYLSEKNLNKDFYLRTKIDQEGFVDSKELLTFNRIKSRGLTSENIVEILRDGNSDVIETRVTLDGTFLLRNKDWDSFENKLTPIDILYAERKKNFKSKQNNRGMGNSLNNNRVNNQNLNFNQIQNLQNYYNNLQMLPQNDDYRIIMIQCLTHKD